VIGAGYFSDFYYDACARIPEVEIGAFVDMNKAKGEVMQSNYKIAKYYSNLAEMLETEKSGFVDIVTLPASQIELIKTIVGHGIPIICLKLLAPSFEELALIASILETNKVRFTVHENFRFQPCHRELKKLLDADTIDTPYDFYFQTRIGDGFGPDAYLSRQPCFRVYKRLLIYETGIHFIHTFRFLAGEITEVYSKTRRLNLVINGEDTAMVLFNFENGAWRTCDANRYNEDILPNKRYTFGNFLIEGSGGSIRLDLEGKITIQKLGETSFEHHYTPSTVGFAGDCCHATQQHFIQSLIENKPFETSIDEYLKSLKIQELVY